MATDRFGERWAAALEDIGIFPTEKIYGKDIQTPTIGIEAGEEGFDWGKITPRTEEEQREIEEAQRKAAERKRIKREKEQYGGVTFEEYKRRIQAGWKFNPRGGVYGEGKWISPRLAAPTFGAPARKVSLEEEKYPELATFNERVSKILRSKEFMALSELEKLPYYEKFEAQRTKITDRIEKKIATKTKQEADADEDVNFAELWQVIKDVNAGTATSTELALYLKSKNVSEDLFNSIMEEIPEPPTAKETEEIFGMKQERERKRKENELVNEFGDEYPWLRLSDKKAELFVGAMEAKRQFDLDEDEQKFRQTLDEGKTIFEQEQATTKQQNWVTERQDKLDALEIKEEQWTKEFGAERAQELVKREHWTLDYLEKVRATQSNEAITKNTALMNYEIAGIKEEHSWVQAQHTMGLERLEFNQTTWEFMQTFDWNKVKEETRAREFGQTYRLDVTKEAAIQDRFTKELAVEMDRLNNKIAVDWADLTLRGDIEQRISTMAMLNYSRLVKELGIKEAEVEIKKLKEKREWWLQGEELRLDNEEAQLKFIETMSKIANDATKVGIQQALANASIANMQDTLQYKYDALAQKSIDEGISPIRISPTLSVTLGNMSSEMQDEVTRWMTTVYDEKKGFYHPKPEEWELINNFLFGKEGDPRPKERFGVNLDVDEFIRGCAGQFDFSDQMKGWCAVTRDKEFMWEKVIAAGVEKGVYVSPDIEGAGAKRGWFETGLGKTLRGIGDTFKNWFTFTEPVAPGVELTPRVTRTGNIATDAENILTQYGQDISRNDMRKHLSDMGYNEAEINSVLGG